MIAGYEIDLQGTGTGWRVRLLVDGEEVGGGVFPFDTPVASMEAFDDAQDFADGWLRSEEPF